MDTKQVNDALEKLFLEEEARIVFWNDPDTEFADYMSEQLFSPVEGVQVIRLDQTSALEVKLQVERREPESRFLIYSAKEEPDYENDWLLVTDFAHHLHGQFPSALEHLILPQAGQANAVVCLAGWRDSASKGGSYDLLSEYVANRISLRNRLASFDADALIDVETFVDVEKEIACNLKERVIATAETINVEEVREIATRRQAGHWVSGEGEVHTCEAACRGPSLRRKAPPLRRQAHHPRPRRRCQSQLRQVR